MDPGNPEPYLMLKMISEKKGNGALAASYLAKAREAIPGLETERVKEAPFPRKARSHRSGEIPQRGQHPVAGTAGRSCERDGSPAAVEGVREDGGECAAQVPLTLDREAGATAAGQ